MYYAIKILSDKTGELTLNQEVPKNKRHVSTMKGVIARRNAGLNSTFRIRRLVAGVGVENVFPLWGDTLMNYFLFNVGLIFLCSIRINSTRKLVGNILRWCTRKRLQKVEFSGLRTLEQETISLEGQ